jgi:hypothetical protein
MRYLGFDVRFGYLCTCNSSPGGVRDKSGERSYTSLSEDADRLQQNKENQYQTPES